MKKHFGYEPEKFEYPFKKKSGLTPSFRAGIKTNESLIKARLKTQQISLFTMNVCPCPPLKNTYFLSKKSRKIKI